MYSYNVLWTLKMIYNPSHSRKDYKSRMWLTFYFNLYLAYTDKNLKLYRPVDKLYYFSRHPFLASEK